MQSRTRTLTRTLFRQHTTVRAITAIRIRPFSRTAVPQKSATETVKDAAKTVDKAIASKIVDGIEVGQTATQKVKDAAAAAAAAANGSSREAKGDAKGKAAEATGSVKGKAQEVVGEAKGKAKEVKGEVKGKVEEVKGKL